MNWTLSKSALTMKPSLNETGSVNGMDHRDSGWHCWGLWLGRQLTLKEAPNQITFVLHTSQSSSLHRPTLQIHWSSRHTLSCAAFKWFLTYFHFLFTQKYKCLCVYAICTAAQGGQNSWNYSYRWLWATVLMLGTEPHTTKHQQSTTEPSLQALLLNFFREVLGEAQNGKCDILVRDI